MTVIQFKNIETARLVTLDLDLKVLSSDGVEVYIQDVATFTILKHFFLSTETIIRYDFIASIIKEYKSISHMNDCSDNIIANKYIFKVRNILKSLRVENFIVTVRGFGYKISNKWLSLVDKKSDINSKNNFLIAISRIIDESIQYSESATIIQDKSGLCFIKPSKEVVINHFNQMNDCYCLFFEEYSSPGNSIELIELRDKITKILSYAIYWRVGDSLTNDKFRADYKNELMILLKQVKQTVNLIN